MKAKGRPRVEAQEPSVRLSVTLTAKEYDRYCDQALREEISLAAVIRRELTKKD